MPYTWDANGNLLSDGVYTYAHNHANQLVSVSGAGKTVSYGYRCNGLSSDGWGIIGCESDRVSQTVNGITTHYVLDQAAGLTQVLSDGTNTYLYGVGRIAQYSEAGPEYFLNDALGSVRQLVDTNGSVTLAKDYQPYGEALASAGSGATSYGYTGEMTDDYIELVYLRSRIYSPYLNQFIQRDPIVPDYSNPQNLNAYSYVRNNPINLVDPSGKCVGEDCVDNDHRNLTYWLINAMKVNSQSDEVDHLRQLNRLGNLDIAATLADLIKRQITGEVDITDCDLISAIWDFSNGTPKDVFKREAYTQWTDLVKKGARWDFKKRVLAELGDSVRLCGMNGCSSWFNYDVIANIHFGYVGRAAGFTSLELHIGAGKAQAKDSPGTGKWYTLGDEPADYWAVEMGIYLYHYARPAGLNALWFKIALDTSQSHLKPGKRPTTPYYNYTYGVDEELGPMFPVDYFNGSGEE